MAARLVAVACALVLCAPAARAQGSPSGSSQPGAAATSGSPSVEELAKLKQNPVSGLRQVILTANVSPDADGTGKTQGAYSLQVVWPFSLGEDWRLITYTIVPAVQLPEDPQGDSVFGLSDTLINLFVSPRKPSSLVWGLGPAVALPTRTDRYLGSNRVSLGPAAVGYYAKGAWGAGVVLQNLWSLGGSGIDEVEEFGAQYFLNYNLPRGWYLYSNATITADWTARDRDRWTVPVGGGLGKVFKIGRQSMSLSLQGLWNVETPQGQPTWSLDAQLAFLFP